MRRGAVQAPWYLAADGVVAVRAVDLSAQEDARQFSWTGAGKISVEGPPVDLSAQTGAALLLDWRIDRRGEAPVRLTLGGGALDLGAMLATIPTGAAAETRIPLRCFAEAGGKLEAVGGPLRIDAGEGFGVTIRTVRIAEAKNGDDCPPKAR
jgi:beta-glucosidase